MPKKEFFEKDLIDIRISRKAHAYLMSLKRHGQPIYHLIGTILDVYRRDVTAQDLQRLLDEQTEHTMFWKKEALNKEQQIIELKYKLGKKDGNLEPFFRNEDDTAGIVHGNEVLHGKPISDTSKLKTFTDVVKGLMALYHGEVSEQKLIPELINTGIFSQEEAGQFIRQAMQNGQIYERREGVYAKA